MASVADDAVAVLAREYRYEMGAPSPAEWVVGPLTVALAPVGRLMGYRGRDDEYSGPVSATAAH